MTSQETFPENLNYNPCQYIFPKMDATENQSIDIPVSPLSKLFHASIVDAQPGQINVKFIVTPQMVNPAGVLHGGIQCAILDEVIGMTGASLGFSKFMYAIDLKVDYLRKARLGQTLNVKGKVIKVGRSIVNCTAEIFSKDCKLIAQAKSNLMVNHS